MLNFKREGFGDDLVGDIQKSDGPLELQISSGSLALGMNLIFPLLMMLPNELELYAS